jgi:signal transduction histidine kinase
LVARPGAPVDQAKKVARLVDEAITQARNLARGLYPVKLESEGFYSAMQELAANIRAAHKLECDFESADSISIDDHAVATHLYRIAQEGANNAAKHAQPKQIQIRLRCVADKIHLTISDDGTGMSAAPDRTNGMGLHIMNYRAGMIGAALKIERQLNGGTLVSCIFEHRNNRKNI